MKKWTSLVRFKEHRFHTHVYCVRIQMPVHFFIRLFDNCAFYALHRPFVKSMNSIYSWLPCRNLQSIALCPTHMHKRRPRCILLDAPRDCGPAAFIGLLYQSYSAIGLIVLICHIVPAIWSCPALPFTKEERFQKFDLTIDYLVFNFEYYIYIYIILYLNIYINI